MLLLIQLLFMRNTQPLRFEEAKNNGPPGSVILDQSEPHDIGLCMGWLR